MDKRHADVGFDERCDEGEVGQQRAIRLQHTGAFAQDCVQVLNMFEHLVRYDDVELAGLERNALGVAGDPNVAIVFSAEMR